MIRLFVLKMAMATLCAAAPAPLHEGREVEANDQKLNGFIVAHDVTAAARIYTDDFVLTTSSGKTRTKADMLRDIELPALNFEINSTSNVQVRQHADTAVLTGTLHQKGSINGKNFDTTLLVTDTWIRDDAHGWRLLAGHASAISP